MWTNLIYLKLDILIDIWRITCLYQYVQETDPLFIQIFEFDGYIDRPQQFGHY